ncbi:MAG: hypothetical protein ACTSRG_23500 [Candidatus Helarchaeota archaeon]
MSEKAASMRKFRLELTARELLKNILEEKMDQCCFKINNRLVDGFIIGATRALFFDLNRIGAKIDVKHSKEIMNIDQLVDREKLFLILRIIGYYDRLKNARDEIEKENAHTVIFNLNECLTLTEEYFKAGWITDYGEYNFQKIISEEEYIDSAIIKDFNQILFEKSE